MEIMSENSKYALHEHMQQITTPLQVIWGKQDQVCVSIIQELYIENTHMHIVQSSVHTQCYFSIIEMLM